MFVFAETLVDIIYCETHDTTKGLRLLKKKEMLTTCVVFYPRQLLLKTSRFAFPWETVQSQYKFYNLIFYYENYLKLLSR